MATVVNVSAPEVCDRCTAQAYWLYEHEGYDGDLRFCCHHSYKFMPALRVAGFTPALLVVRGLAPVE